MAYAQLADLKRELGIPDNSTGDDPLLQQKITDAQSAIDTFCRRSFEATTATRYYSRFYDGLRGYALYLESDLLTVTALTNGNDQVIPVDGSGYWLEPRNSPPYNIIRLKSSYVWIFNVDGEITVTGTWGYSATAPGAIVEACLKLAKYYYRLKDTNTLDMVATPELAGYKLPRGLPQDVYDMLVPFKRGGLR